MPRFFGKVGYGEPVEIRPGVSRDTIVERSASGDVFRDTRASRSGDKVNNDISVGNLISIVMDAYSTANFHNIRYVVWNGTRWTVPQVEVQRPRLILTLGEVYNGPVPTP
jgi:hypothetical protein